MAKIGLDLTRRKAGTGAIPGPRMHKYHRTLDEAVEQAGAMAKHKGEAIVVYYSERRYSSCRYRCAPSWKGKWRGERQVYIVGVPGITGGVNLS